MTSQDAVKFDVDTLPLTQQLVMEVLAARHRTGERMWTFTSKAKRACEALANLRLVGYKDGVVERTLLVWLTEDGKRAVLDPDYVLPRDR